MANRGKMDMAVGKISDIRYTRNISQVLHFKVLHRNASFVSSKGKRTYIFIIGDGTSNIVLLGLDGIGKKAWRKLKVDQCYKMYPGGATAYLEREFPQISNQPHRMTLRILNSSLIDSNPNAAFLNSVSSQLNFQFTRLESIGLVPGDRGSVGVDIIAKVFQKKNTVGDAAIKGLQLVDMGRQGKDLSVICTLQLNHTKTVVKRGHIVVIFNAHMKSTRKGLELIVSNGSTLFQLKTLEDCWMLSAEQKNMFEELLSVPPVIKAPARRTTRAAIANQENGSAGLGATVNHTTASTSTASRALSETSSTANNGSSSTFVNDGASTSKCKQGASKELVSISGLKKQKRTPQSGQTTLQKYQTTIRNRPNSISGYTLKNIRLNEFALKRYIGCSVCISSLKGIDGQYRCTGVKCRGTERETQPKKRICYRLEVKAIGDKEIVNETVNFVCFDKVMVKFMGKSAGDFETDMDATHEFKRKLREKELNMKITFLQQSADGSKPLIVDLAVFPLLEQTLPFHSTRTIAYNVNSTGTGGNNLQLTDDERRIADELWNGSDSSDVENDDLELNADEHVSNVQLSKKEWIEVTVTVRKPNQRFSVNRINDEETYDTFSKQGLAVVICIEEIISNRPGISHRRKGAQHDIRLACDLFDQLGFKVVQITNVKSEDLLAELDEVKKMIRSGDFSSLFVCLSTHGRAVEVMMADGLWVNLWNDIIYRFDDEELPEFIGRPKVFLVQRCQAFRDTEFDHKAHLPRRERFVQEMETDAENIVYDKPLANHPNTLVFTSNSPGFNSTRTSMGSYFFRAIALVFMKHACELELRQLLQMVSKIMNKPRNRKNKHLTELKDYLFVSKFYFNIDE